MNAPYKELHDEAMAVWRRLRCSPLTKYLAAKRAMAIINTMPPGPYKAKHNKFLFVRFNQLRAQCIRIGMSSHLLKLYASAV